MALDAYSPCPAGTGKKIKFCCADLLGELQKIDRMIEGEQRLACLDHLERLEEKYPGRACLLTLKARLQMQLGQGDARETLGKVLARDPTNPIALSESGLQVLTQDGPAAGVRLIQQALAACPDEVPSTVLDVVGAAGLVLASIGNTLAGRAHLRLVLQKSPHDQAALEMLQRLNMSPLALAERDDYPFAPAPEKVAWRGKFQEALQRAQRGDWLEAEPRFAALAVTAPEAPAVWRNLALVRSYLVENAKAVEAWRRLATLEVPRLVSLDEAVEAELLAQLLDDNAPMSTVDSLAIEYAIRDFDTLLARLASDHRLLAMPSDSLPRHNENEPPPRAGYLIWDRDPLPENAPVERTTLPRLLGNALVFGRQTDREARVELIAFRNDDLPASQARLTAAAGDALGERVAERVEGQVERLQVELNAALRLPVGALPADARRVTREHRQHVLFHVWPDLPDPSLNGKTPRQAAADPALRIPVLAQILHFEYAPLNDRDGFDFDPLRQSLGLPVPAPIDPWHTRLESIPLVRLARVQTEKLDDKDLLVLFQVAMISQARAALRRLGQEITGRESLRQQVDVAEVHGALARVATSIEEAVAQLDQARAVADSRQQSTARWDLQELVLQLEFENVTEIERLFRHISTEHANEPGVRAQLMQILIATGIIRPDGSMAGRPRAAEPAAPAAAEPGKLWTPDAEGQSSAAGTKPSIWIPGME